MSVCGGSSVCAVDFRPQGQSCRFSSCLSRSPAITSGLEMGKCRLRRGGGARVHKNPPAETVPLPFGKGQQPGLGLNGFVHAGPWASNWVFFLIPVILDDLEQMLQDYCRSPKVTAGRKQPVPAWQHNGGLRVSLCLGYFSPSPLLRGAAAPGGIGLSWVLTLYQGAGVT